ncbi:hypothetical protein F4V43_01710 [Paenibacillus spiritus]|uniref:Uncharacterized protein n=1 Tax=Paenibacillus spiritus TaxID=2496557 RepID=A0A5J5GG90_9BACL|nr:hypothetical protein [Paenibacillus spiritus]KAA9007229.1 hypothetical protein F4V43_01710 [Paenibacillus spiritus]
MKINTSVIYKYMKLCPASTSKCDSFADIKFKILRAVAIGKIMKAQPLLEIQYGNLKLNIDYKNNKVIDIEKNYKDAYEVSEELKEEFEKEYYYIVV